ncbi:MAG: WD40 repeat domain-containing serine/threonine protein kinase [Verrucomicrobiales bacterium]
MTDLQIFKNAPPSPTPEELQAYLDEACGEDADLRAKVEELIQASKAAEKAETFMQQPALELDEEKSSVVIGRYKLLQKVGEGGFGVVYMADQLEPVERRVALKIIKAGMDTRQVIARFEAERQALALMDHPNIARVLDAGETDEGRPYFVMELVKGIPITDYCASGKLCIDARLALFTKVCHAVQHAHGKGIIHRDLKPSNIMVTVKDGEPVPKVIDFGIAKATEHRLTDKTLFTRYEQMIGTPTYMSPEQAALSGMDVDTRCDIYALGVLLYELLTGTTPFDAKTLQSAAFDEMRRIIREDEPPRPSTRVTQLRKALDTQRSEVRIPNSSIANDLDWIVMKCLEKDRNRRYETANGLAMDIERFVGGELVLARPPSTWYRLQKVVQRNKLAFAAGAAVFVALVIGFVVALWGLAKANEHSKVALERAEDLSRQVYLRQLTVADQALHKNHYPSARRALDACDPRQRGWEWRFLERRFHSATVFKGGGVEQPLFTNDGRQLIAIGDPNEGTPRISIWDVATQSQVGELTHDSPIWCVDLARRNHWIAAGDQEGKNANVILWDLSTQRVLWKVRATQGEGSKGRFDGLAFSPDERWIATAHWDKHLRVFSSTDGALVFDLDLSNFLDWMHFRRPRFSPDGEWITVNGLLVRVADQSVVSPFPEGTIIAEFSPNGEMIASGNPTEKRIHLWRWNGDDGTVTAVHSWRGANSSRFQDMHFCADGAHLATLQGVHLAVWDVGDPGKNVAYMDAPDLTYWLGVHSESHAIAYSIGGDLRVWNYMGGQDRICLPPQESACHLIRFSPDGRMIAMGSHRGQHGMSAASQEVAGPIRIVESESGDLVKTLEGHFKGFSWMPMTDSRSLIVTRAETETHEIHNVVTGTVVRHFAESFAIARPFSDRAGEIVTSIGEDFTVRKWSARTGDLIDTYRIGRVHGGGDVASPVGGLWNAVVGPRNHYVALAQGWDIRVWDTRAKREVTPQLPSGGRASEAMGFLPNGSRIYAVSDEENFEIFDIQSNQRVRWVTGPFGALDLSPDEQYIVSCGGGLVIWDIENRLPIITLSEAPDFMSVAWSPDNQRIAAGRADGSVLIWTLPTHP